MKEPPPLLELRHLRLVAEITAHGSVTVAAQQLRLTQPGVSHQLRDLETRLRTPLFIRTAKRMIPTAAGEELAAIARQVLQQVRQYERQIIAGDFSQALGSIRFAIQNNTSYYWLPELLKIFRHRWPGVELRVGPEHSERPLQAVRDGRLDLALVYARLPDRRVAYSELLEDEFVLLLHVDHRLSRMHSVAVEELKHEHLLLFNSSEAECFVSSELLAPAGVTPARVSRVQLTDAIVEFVRAGLGITVLPAWATQPYLGSGRLRTVRIGEGVRRMWYAASRADEPEPAFQRELIDLVRRQLTRVWTRGRRTA